MVLRFCFFAGIAMLLALGGSALPAVASSPLPEVPRELKIKEKFEFYDITGATVGELGRQMRKNGTSWKDGKEYAAVTRWDIHYNYDIFSGDGGCSVKSVKTDVDIVYHLPRRLSSGADSKLAAQWDIYLAHLKQHEFGHKDIAVKAAAEINEILASLPSFKSRAELEQEANRRTRQKFQWMKEVQIKYDDDTRHGETQGAILTAD